MAGVHGRSRLQPSQQQQQHEVGQPGNSNMQAKKCLQHTDERLQLQEASHRLSSICNKHWHWPGIQQPGSRGETGVHGVHHNISHATQQCELMLSDSGLSTCRLPKSSAGWARWGCCSILSVRWGARLRRKAASSALLVCRDTADQHDASASPHVLCCSLHQQQRCLYVDVQNLVNGVR